MSVTGEYALLHTRPCLSCDMLLPDGAFSKHDQTGNLRNTCDQCRATQTNLWVERNRSLVQSNQREYNRRYRGRAINLCNQARNRATKKGVPFLLTHDDVIAGISVGFCVKTGIAFDLQPYGDGTHQSPYGPSIDKIDPKGLYEPSNVQYVCFWYNCAKQQWPEHVLLEMCRTMVKLYGN